MSDVRDYLALFDVDDDQLGFVIGPRVDEYAETVGVEINVRMLEEQEDSIYGIDGTYTYDGATLEHFLVEIYPELIEQFEETFEDSRLQYYESETG